MIDTEDKSEAFRLIHALLTPNQNCADHVRCCPRMVARQVCTALRRRGQAVSVRTELALFAAYEAGYWLPERTVRAPRTYDSYLPRRVRRRKPEG